MNLDKFSYPTITFICKTCTKGKQHAAKFGIDAKRLATKNTGDCAFGCLWPYEDHVHMMGKIFCHFIDDFLRKV
jgi:hypothetical protein